MEPLFVLNELSVYPRRAPEILMELAGMKTGCRPGLILPPALQEAEAALRAVGEALVDIHKLP